tara:strand:- start:16307 stop:17050 length:744 start_codon:yes stop_codon:yes gene_type:complete
MTKEVVKQKKSELAVIDFAADAKDGLDNISRDDLAVPFVNIVQKTSPIIDANENAKAGMIHNSVSDALYEHVLAIPCGYKRSFVEWKPRESGGGYVGEHAASAAISQRPRNEKGEIVLENGNILVETAYMFVCLFHDTTGLEQAVITMSSTQLKKARRWNSQIMGLKVPGPDGSLVTPAIYSHVYHLTTKQESNDKGSWYGWNIEVSGPVTDKAVYDMSKAFASVVKEGAVQVSPPQQQNQEVKPDF